jgi:hypothetical protein
MTWHHDDLCIIVMTMFRWIVVMNLDCRGLCRKLYFCLLNMFCDLFWTLPIRGDSQNRAYIKKFKTLRSSVNQGI